MCIGTNDRRYGGAGKDAGGSDGTAHLSERGTTTLIKCKSNSSE